MPSSSLNLLILFDEKKILGRRNDDEYFFNINDGVHRYIFEVIKMVKNLNVDLFGEVEVVVGSTALLEFRSLALRVVKNFSRASVDVQRWLVNQTRHVYSRGLKGDDFSREMSFKHLEDLGAVLDAEHESVVEDFFLRVFDAGDSNRVRNSLVEVAPLPKSFSEGSVSYLGFLNRLGEPQGVL